MQVTKRNGTTEPYNREKIAVAIRKSFASTGREAADDTIQKWCMRWNPSCVTTLQAEVWSESKMKWNAA